MQIRQNENFTIHSRPEYEILQLKCNGNVKCTTVNESNATRPEGRATLMKHTNKKKIRFGTTTTSKSDKQNPKNKMTIEPLLGKFIQVSDSFRFRNVNVFGSSYTMHTTCDNIINAFSAQSK